MSTGVKLCPHCGGKMFAAKIIRGCIVEATEDGDFKVLKENTERHDIEVLKCGRCKNDLTNNDLVSGVTCKECGKVVNPNDINEAGVCTVCQAQKARSELANASREDLIRMLLDAERKAKMVVEQPSSVCNVSVPSGSGNEESNPEKPTEIAPAEDEETKNKKRGASRKKATKDESVEQSQQPTEEPDMTAMNAIADQQTAPFPDFPSAPEMDLSSAINPPEQPLQQNEQFGVNNQFEMFQSDESF